MEDGGWRMKMEAEGERERGKEGLRRRHSRQGGEDERQRQNPPSQTHHNRNNKLYFCYNYYIGLVHCFNASICLSLQRHWSSSSTMTSHIPAAMLQCSSLRSDTAYTIRPLSHGTA